MAQQRARLVGIDHVALEVGDPVQVVSYGDVQLSKTGGVLAGMGLEGLGKSERALDELQRKGLA